jgi:tellurite resistance protein TerA
MVILDKSGEKARISLDKKQAVVGDIRINLRWSSGAPQKKAGFFASLFGGGGSAGGIDLDLGVFVEAVDGSKSILDPLQSAFQAGNRGSLSSYPWLLHSGDDRSGGGGEVVQVSGANIGKIRRIIVYTFIYEGAPAWRNTDARVTIEAPGCEPVDVRMGEQSDSRSFCALACLAIQNGEHIQVERLMTFHQGHHECDIEYGWGFRWTAGSK